MIRGILVAPDSFKGSLGATGFCEIAEQALAGVLPGCRIFSRPMADGGEGTVEALVKGAGGEIRSARVTGPMGDPVEAHWGLLADGRTAVVEMAAASGLPLVPEDQRDPLLATSFGTGELIAGALDAGAQEIILGIGGSATNDGGAGALQALGFVFVNGQGRALGTGAAALRDLAGVRRERVHPRLGEVRLLIASDVTNPLLGPTGATMVYGPQKGADAEALRRLEAALGRYAEVLVRETGTDHRKTPGAGAAGGMGFGFLSLCGADIRSGFELIASVFRLDELLASGDVGLVITGEGEINHQSSQGKLIGRLAAMAASHRVPLVALAGAVRPDTEGLYGQGVSSMQSIVSRPMSLREAMADTGTLLRQRIVDLAHLLSGLGLAGNQ